MTAIVYVAAALAEIAGCFSFWMWLRQDKPVWWIAPGIASLCLFAWLLTLVDSDAAGRAYAAYGGVYVAVAILWLWWIDGIRPSAWDLAGAAVTLMGMAIIAFQPR